jgi:hypothetical protein
MAFWHKTPEQIKAQGEAMALHAMAEGVKIALGHHGPQVQQQRLDAACKVADAIARAIYTKQGNTIMVDTLTGLQDQLMDTVSIRQSIKNKEDKK